MSELSDLLRRVVMPGREIEYAASTVERANALQAENAKLREALAAIRDDGMPDPELFSDAQALRLAWELIARIQKIARTALRPAALESEASDG